MRLILLACFGLFSCCAFSDWSINTEQSQLAFSSTKNSTITENHHFTDFNGNVTAEGAAQLTINISSVETNIDIRDQRLKDLFFKVADFPTAQVTLNVPKSALKNQKIGSSKKVTTDARIQLLDKVLTQPVVLNIRYQTANTVEVRSAQPVMLDIEEYSLLAGLNKLQALAGLNSIDTQVPVSFKLVFIQQPSKQ